MSERDSTSEVSSSNGSNGNPPAIPPDSPGSSVSSRLQEEYDELLKYAVVVPDYSRRSIPGRLTDTRTVCDQQNDIITVRASSNQSGFSQDEEKSTQREGDEEGERTPRGRGDQSGGSVKHLPDFGQSPIGSRSPKSFTGHTRDNISGRSTTANGGYHQGSIPMASNPLFDMSNRPVEALYTATIDQDVCKMETMLDHWCLELKRNVLAEFSKAKIVIEQKSRQELLQETARHCQEKAELVKELDSLKEFLHTYQQSMQRKDSIISNLTEAMYRQRDKQQLIRNFSQWKIYHNDAKREAFATKLAKCHHEQSLKRRVISAWFSLIHKKWRQRVEKACQVKAQEVCMQLTTDYESKITALNEAQESAREDIRRLQIEREKYQETMKKAFMRGVCALNMEAMSMFHGEENNNAATAPFGAREDRDGEEDFFDNLDSQVPDKGLPSSKTIPHETVHSSASVDASAPKIVTSQGSRSMSASSAPPRQTPAKPSSVLAAAHKMCVVPAMRISNKKSELGRFGARPVSPSHHPAVASVVVERHQPVTKQTIGPATRAKFARTTTESEQYRKLAGQHAALDKAPPIHTVRVVD